MNIKKLKFIFILTFIVTTIFIKNINAQQLIKKESIDVFKNAINIKVEEKQDVKIGEKYNLFDNKEVPISLLYEDTTYVSVRKIAELLNLEIEWDEKTKTARISEKFDNYGYNDLKDKDHILNKDSVDNIVNDIKNSKFKIIYIGSPKCPACNSYVPVLNDITKKMGIKEISYIQVDGLSKEEASIITKEFGIKSIPATIIIKDGVIKEKVIGNKTSKDISNILQDAV